MSASLISIAVMLMPSARTLRDHTIVLADLVSREMEENALVTMKYHGLLYYDFNAVEIKDLILKRCHRKCLCF